MIDICLSVYEKFHIYFSIIFLISFISWKYLNFIFFLQLNEVSRSIHQVMDICLSPFPAIVNEHGSTHTSAIGYMPRSGVAGSYCRPFLPF